MEDKTKIYPNTTEPKEEKPFNLITVKGKLVNDNINMDKTSEILISEDEEYFLMK